MIDDDILKLAFKHCYASMSAGGFVFTRDRMIEFARALLAASAPNPSDKQEAVAEIVNDHDGKWIWFLGDNEDALPTGTLLYAAPLAQSAEQDRIDAEYREVGVWEPDGSKFKTYRNENLNGVAMYVREAKGARK